mgnify:CR=1 FL=1
MYEKENKLMADRCAIRQSANGWCIGDSFPIWNESKWTIEDPRCREIIREKFKLNTYNVMTEKWKSWVGEFKGEGKTIAEAECECIKAICKGIEE